MKKIITTCIMVACLSWGFGQNHSVFSDDFESGQGTWFQQFNNLDNKFVFEACAGNGPTLPGGNSLYISSGGVGLGCGPGAEEHYGYQNSSLLNDSVIVYNEVDASCLSTLEISFDYQIEGDAGTDFGYVVYSTDAGVSWVQVGSELSAQSTWTNTSFALPASLGGTTFLIGFKFEFDNVNSGSNPLAVDNVDVRGGDSTPPILICQGDEDVDASANCDFLLLDYKSFILNLDDNCSDSVDLVLSMTPPVGSFLTTLNTPIPIEITATDQAGNETTCDFSLTVLDVTAPIVTCPSDTNLYLDGSCNYSVVDYTTLLNINENCTALNDLTITQSIPPGTIFNTPNTSQNVSFDVEDTEGNIGSCSFNLLFADSTKPVITCPNDTVIYVNNSCAGALDNYIPFTSAVDNCESGMAILQSPVQGSAVNGAGTVEVVTMSVNDGHGNIQTCEFNVTALDTLAPTIICPADQSENGDANCESILNDYTGSVISSTDNCSVGSITQSPAIGTIVSGATNEIVLTISDAIGNENSCTFNVEVIDVVDPIVICPNDTTVPVNASCLGNLGDYTTVSSATDNCALTTFTPIQSPAPGAVAVGSGTVVVVTIDADDDAGNTGSCSFNVTMIDTIRPAISCPSNSDEDGDANCEFTAIDYTSGVSVNDNCSASGNILVSQSIPMGNNLVGGVNTIILTAEDEAGNQETCSFEVTVIDVLDPSIDVCPPDQGVFADENCDAVLTDYTDQVTASDNCSDVGNLTITQSPLPGLIVTTTQNVTITVADEAGNSTQCSFTVTKADSTAPVVVCPSDIDIASDASCNYTVGDYIPLSSATDNCSASMNLVFSQSPISGSLGNGLLPIIISAEDEVGNVGTCTFNLIPTDVIPPVITTCAPNDTLYVDGNCEAIVPDYSGTITVTDACGGVVVTQSEAIGSALTVGTTTVTLTATDPGSNTDDCTFDIIVRDTVSPTILCPVDTSICTTLFTFVEPVGIDNCSGASTLQIDGTGLSSGSHFPLGQTILEYEVTDAGNNSTTCQFRVTVLDWSDTAQIINPEIYLCDTITTLIEAEEPSSGVGTWTLISGSAIINNENSYISGVNAIGLGETVIVWEITNSGGCPTSSDTLTIQLNQTPTVANVGFDLEACKDTFQLNGNFVIKGEGLWEHVGGVATFADSSDPNSFVYDFPEGENLFVWTISAGSCVSTSDTLSVIRYGQPTIGNILSNDTTICDSVSFLTVVAEEPDYGSGVWALIQGTGSFTDNDSTVNSISGFSGGENKYIWVVRNEICTPLVDTISITVEVCGDFVDVPTLLTPNYDGKNDIWVIPYLNDFYPECKVEVYNKWGGQVFESDGYNDPWDCKYKDEILPAGAYFYTIDLGNGQKPLTGSLTLLK